MPEELRERVKTFGLDPKEFPETGHWPHQLYIREGRRMVSDYVMTQANCERERDRGGLGRPRLLPDGLPLLPARRGRGERPHHRPQRGRLRPPLQEGPYPVSYRSIVPKKEECANLLVPVSLSASHVAFGSIRMEPVFMILGQSAGTAAAIAIDGKQAVQEVPYDKLKDLLVKQGQRL